MRYGTPMYKPDQECRCYVTIEFPDGRTAIRLWRSSSGAKAIRKAARKKYPDCRLAFGNVFWVTL